ncbi:MAG TPA: HAMP domain-containing histidine kinase [Candidatus Avirikenella pullistercoris]|nr:HAMP domain-containing histidine kinase [Candidatus Avirikenella pullistercoris]
MIEKKFTLNRSASYKRKLIYISIGLVIGLCSLMFTNYIVRELAQKEHNEIQLWSHAMAMAGGDENLNPAEQNRLNELIGEIIDNNTSIPSIVTDEYYRVLKYSNIPQKVIDNPKLLRKELEDMASSNDPIEVNIFNYNRIYIFYNESQLLKMLRYFPYVQLSVIAIFIMFAFITFRISKQDEQNRIWIGMAKETAHQLGTPTSSLLGWIEYLKSQNTEQFVIEEMSKDITRLLKVVDRFSKIGSASTMVPRNIYELVNNAVSYFKTRIPKNVTLRYNTSVSAPLQALVNEALFEWVIENLLKNALDALQGKGYIDVSVYDDNKWIYIDVKDTGKGIAKSNFSKIFNPGYTTKTRGWGLGLSLSKRIINEYHKGRIFVAESELDKGTIMRVMVKKL